MATATVDPQASSLRSAGTGAPSDIGASVAEQLALPLAVVNAALESVWVNDAARLRHDAAWSALAAGYGARGPSAVLRKQLHALVLHALHANGATECLVESEAGTWFASAVALQRHDGLVVLRMCAMHQGAGPGAGVRLQRLFGLSSAEAHVTVQLVCGSSLEHIAQARGVSVATVRAQVRSVFQKTGIHRQGALICAIGWLVSG